MTFDCVGKNSKGERYMKFHIQFGRGDSFIPMKELEAAMEKATVYNDTVIYAEWLPRNSGDPDSTTECYCSHCKAPISSSKSLYYRYCPECGARMDRRLRGMSLKDLERLLDLPKVTKTIMFDEKGPVAYVDYEPFIEDNKE